MWSEEIQTDVLQTPRCGGRHLPQGGTHSRQVCDLSFCSVWYRLQMSQCQHREGQWPSVNQPRVHGKPMLRLECWQPRAFCTLSPSGPFHETWVTKVEDMLYCVTPEIAISKSDGPLGGLSEDPCSERLAMYYVQPRRLCIGMRGSERPTGLLPLSESAHPTQTEDRQGESKQPYPITCAQDPTGVAGRPQVQGQTKVDGFALTNWNPSATDGPTAGKRLLDVINPVWLQIRRSSRVGTQLPLVNQHRGPGS